MGFYYRPVKPSTPTSYFPLCQIKNKKRKKRGQISTINGLLKGSPAGTLPVFTGDVLRECLRIIPSPMRNFLYLLKRGCSIYWHVVFIKTVYSPIHPRIHLYARRRPSPRCNPLMTVLCGASIGNINNIGSFCGGTGGSPPTARSCAFVSSV